MVGMRFRPTVVSVALFLALAFTSVSFGKASHIGWPRINTSTEHFYKSTSSRGVTKSGTAESDELLGYHGNDKLFGLGGSDVIWGDWKPNNPKSQTDHIDGGDGDDFLYSSRGKNRMFGGNGDDFIKGRVGRGTIDCGPGNDVA